MMPPQRLNLIASAKRLGITGSLVIVVAGWGFRTYDATNAKAIDVKAFHDSLVYRRTLDSLRANFEYRELHALALHTDSSVRKVCAALKAVC